MVGDEKKGNEGAWFRFSVVVMVFSFTCGAVRQFRRYLRPRDSYSAGIQHSVSMAVQDVGRFGRVRVKRTKRWKEKSGKMIDRVLGGEKRGPARYRPGLNPG